MIAVNHLEGHALTARLTDGIAFPYLMLLVSGGHTQIVLVRGVGDYERWGTTIDDALGEAFDKTAKLLGLPYPGGPEVERDGRRRAIRRASPSRARCWARPGLDFSFSGLKTAVRQAATGDRAAVATRMSPTSAPSFQAAVADTLADRRRARARALPRANFPDDAAADARRRRRRCRQPGDPRRARGALPTNTASRFVAPPPALCTDNARHDRLGRRRTPGARAQRDGLDAAPRPRWPLDEVAHPLIGAGRRGAKA